MTTRRFECWPEILVAEVHLCMRRPFVWGAHDCALMAAGIVHAIAGVDHMNDLRGTYHTATGARRVLRRLGGLDAALTARMGAPRGDLNHAMRGDVVVIDTPLGRSAGICLGSESVFPSLTGAVFHPTRVCASVWSV